MEINVNKDSIFYKLGKLRGYLEINKKLRERENEDPCFEIYFMDLVSELEEHFLKELE